MRMMRLPLVLLCAGALAAADPAAVPPAQDAIPQIALIPSNISISRQASFSPSGEPQGEQRSCRLTLSLRLLANQLRMGANQDNERRQVVLTSADTDADESLLADGLRHSLWVQPGFRGRQDNEPGAHLILSLKSPSKPFSAFKRLAGSVILPLAGSRLRRIDLKPIGVLAGTRVAIEGMEGIDLGIELKPDQVKLTYPDALFNLLAEVKFFTADGQEVTSHGGGSTGDGQRTVAEYRLALPADGSAVLFLLQDVRSVTIPFELKDLRIFPAPDLAKPTTVLKAVEVENTDAQVPPAGKSNF
jgi:hypothetical protein